MGYLMYIVFAVLVVIPFWKIFDKAGFPAALSLIMLIPIANLVALYFVAFARWPGQPTS
jgi:hypothetical protein